MNHNLNTTASQPPVNYTSKDDYIQKDLENRYHHATGAAELLEIIQQAKFFRYNSLANQMINDLDESERGLWEMPFNQLRIDNGQLTMPAGWEKRLHH